MPENNLSKYRFNHLDDTAFPSLENVDVYEYKNDFDYNRWTDSTKIYMCNVLWNNDYSDVVKFKDDKERDEYFDNIGGYEIELTSAFNVAPDGSIKVPVPYQVATRYNYIFVDLPIMTSEKEPINYEDTRRTQRYYYFINDIVQQSPNSTILIVSPDNWTTYINNVEIPYLMLERGHAPMNAISVNDYLANPYQNNKYLLAPDFDFSTGQDMVKNSRFVPINNGTKYIIFATTMSASQVKNQTYPTALSSTNTPATFANSSARNGYQYIVNDYQWGIGDYNFNGMVTNSTPFQSADGTIPNNMTMIACPSVNAASMFNYMSEHIPFFYETIKACFMVDDTMFTRGDSFTFCNTTCYYVLPASDSILNTLKLTRTQFGYDSKYADITKLYTSPYARIEVTDNDGNIKYFKIENTSNIEIHKVTSLTFPYISIQAYLTGINGSGYSEYSWKKLDNTSDTKKMYADDFGDFLWEWDIPTYALYVKGYDVYKAKSYPSQYLDRYNAIADYHKSVGLDNTQYENAKDAADNTKLMTNNSAKTEYDNAVRMANTINVNNVNSANKEQVNSNASSDTAETNVNNQSTAARENNQRDRELSVYVKERNQANKNNMVNMNNAKIQGDKTYDNWLTSATTSSEVTAGAIGAVANGISGVTSGVASAAGNLGVGNVFGAIGSVMQGGVDMACNGISTYATLTANIDIADNTIKANNFKSNLAQDTNSAVWNVEKEQEDFINGWTNTMSQRNTNTTTTMWNTNADNTNKTNHANAQRTRNTSIDNSGRTRDTSNTNALNTKNNADTNAQLNRNVTVANSNYLRNNLVDNAKITLEQKRIANQQKYNEAKLSPPVQYGTTTGNPMLDAFERRGLQVKIRTQADGDISQAGDLMLRYGYALNQVWNIKDSGMLLMKHYTYWKATDIWINGGEGVNQDAQRDIQNAFENGVTIWKNPNNIGKVSIYDNWN